MKQKEKIRETTIRAEERMQNGTVYRYELIMTESNSFSSYKIPLYYIRVQMQRCDGVISASESETLFADLGFATDFFEKLIRSLAAPADLPYIVEDEFYKRKY